MHDYQRSSAYWDDVFSKESPHAPASSDTGNELMNRALAWLCDGSKTILDFGCGNGSLLFCCAYAGTREHIGIDLSHSAILSAQTRAKNMHVGMFSFLQGGIECLSGLSDASFDGVILSNIIDNLYPDDTESVLQECARVVKSGGKVLVKLNPHLTQEQVNAWNIRVIEGNLLDDGLPLWNNTTEEWMKIIGRYFALRFSGSVYYPEFEQTNRLMYYQKASSKRKKGNG